jgi:hypothetical protein
VVIGIDLGSGRGMNCLIMPRLSLVRIGSSPHRRSAGCAEIELQAVAVEKPDELKVVHSDKPDCRRRVKSERERSSRGWHRMPIWALLALARTDGLLEVEAAAARERGLRGSRVL